MEQTIPDQPSTKRTFLLRIEVVAMVPKAECATMRLRPPEDMHVLPATSGSARLPGATVLLRAERKQTGPPDFRTRQKPPLRIESTFFLLLNGARLDIACHYGVGCCGII